MLNRSLTAARQTLQLPVQTAATRFRECPLGHEVALGERVDPVVLSGVRGIKNAKPGSRPEPSTIAP